MKIFCIAKDSHIFSTKNNSVCDNLAGAKLHLSPMKALKSTDLLSPSSSGSDVVLEPWQKSWETPSTPGYVEPNI